MDILINLIVFLVGIGVGFIAVKFLSPSTEEQNTLATQVEKSELALAQYKKDVAEHLDSSAKLLEAMNATCQTAMSQMEKNTALLQQATPEENSVMPFFSKETQEGLAQTLSERKHTTAKSEEITEAPRDYSSQPSGLLNDETQSVTELETSR